MLQISNIGKSPVLGIVPGWNGFEFEVPYCQDYSGTDIIISAYDKKITEYNFTGYTSSETNGSITTTTTGTATKGIVSAVANIAGPAANNFVDKLVTKAKIGDKIKKLIVGIPASGFTSAIKAGLNLIFGKTTTTTLHKEE